MENLLKNGNHCQSAKALPAVHALDFRLFKSFVNSTDAILRILTSNINSPSGNIYLEHHTNFTPRNLSHLTDTQTCPATYLAP